MKKAINGHMQLHSSVCSILYEVYIIYGINNNSSSEL